MSETSIPKTVEAKAAERPKAKPQKRERPEGLLLLHKGRGYTSHDAVKVARRALRQKKIGHCGTLDPEATGLLLLTLGRATRLTRFLIKAPKVYTGAVTLGRETDTYDAAGEVTREASVDAVTEDAIRSIMASFEGSYEQTPPPYCAKKVNGKKYYELARRGEETPKEARSVEVFRFEPTEIAPSPISRVEFELACASGTYARSLAHHLGQELGCGGHLSRLHRTVIGTFSVEDAASLDQLDDAEGDTGKLGCAFIPFDEIPLPFLEAQADLTQERRIRHGQKMLAPGLASEEGDWVKITSSRGLFLAVGTVDERLGGEAGMSVIQPRIVFAN